MRRDALLLIALVALASISCSPPRHADAPSDQSAMALVGPTPQSSALSHFPRGAVVRSAVWNFPRGPAAGPVKVPVCWEALEPQLSAQRLLAQRAVEETWSHVAGISFTGWQECETGMPGIHILTTSDARARVNWLGKDLNGQTSGMELNLAFAGWENTACKNIPDRCLRAIVVHEFGHALGFVHEQLNEHQGKAPSECDAERGPPYPNYSVTSYDAASIMNYCNSNWILGDLSAQDILSAQILYGARI